MNPLNAKDKVTKAIEDSRKKNMHLQVIASDGPLNSAIFNMLQEASFQSNISRGQFDAGDWQDVYFISGASLLSEDDKYRLSKIFNAPSVRTTFIVTSFLTEERFSGDHLMTVNLDD